jgi:hypothetical protein
MYFIAKNNFKLQPKMSRLDTRVLSDPVAEVRDPGEHIWIAPGASNDPRGNALLFAVNNQGTATVAHADTLTRAGQSADILVCDESSVAAVALFAVSSAQGLQLDDLQVVRDTSWVLKQAIKSENQ